MITNNLLFKVTAIVCGCLLLVCSCSKNDDPINEQDPGSSGDDGETVYIAGYEGNVAKYWKNGVATSLTDGTKNAHAIDISVSGNDIYVAGTEGKVAKYWKNGKVSVLGNLAKEEYAFSMYVSGNDVYVAGMDDSSNGSIPKYWKNGIAVELAKSGMAEDIFVSGGDVYVAGDEDDAVYWKNGHVVNLANGEKARAIFISGNDVYVAGEEDIKNENGYYTYYTNIVKYWKNGNAVNLTDGKMEAWATDIFISGDDVYVSGCEATTKTSYGSGDKYQAKYWKNGKEVLLTDRETESFAYKIYISGNDVYVVGEELHATTGKYVAKCWKNGTAIALTDGTQHATAYSIVVK
ncbi:MAG: hypothetical protein RBS73_14315 [Prolixibacteraceae bacterium]|jgi:hypothetical protein|nr:hypothetical protein [Prolixibacteraceae bacterium]